MATVKTLEMTFNMDNSKTAMISLADPVSSLQASDVQPVMANIVAKQAIVSGSALPNGIHSAILKEVSETTLI